MDGAAGGPARQEAKGSWGKEPPPPLPFLPAPSSDIFMAFSSISVMG